jgi:hypothetical protein
MINVRGKVRIHNQLEPKNIEEGLSLHVLVSPLLIDQWGKSLNKINKGG